MMSSIVWVSSRGMTFRMESSICANFRSVSSMRVPGTPRTCSLMSPASTVGKKSRPTSGNRASETPTKARKPETTSARCCRVQPSHAPYAPRRRAKPRSNAPKKPPCAWSSPWRMR